eukprot:gene8765-1143_t
MSGGKDLDKKLTGYNFLESGYSLEILLLRQHTCNYNGNILVTTTAVTANHNFLFPPAPLPPPLSLQPLPPPLPPALLPLPLPHLPLPHLPLQPLPQPPLPLPLPHLPLQPLPPPLPPALLPLPLPHLPQPPPPLPHLPLPHLPLQPLPLQPLPPAAAAAPSIWFWREKRFAIIQCKHKL